MQSYVVERELQMQCREHAALLKELSARIQPALARNLPAPGVAGGGCLPRGAFRICVVQRDASGYGMSIQNCALAEAPARGGAAAGAGLRAGDRIVRVHCGGATLKAVGLGGASKVLQRDVLRTLPLLLT